ncbi:MAG: cupin domain-containing protein [Pseudomonadota bacterium]
MTDNRFSAHLVRIKSGCEIGEHIHDNNWELHEPIEGTGKGFLANKEVAYELGTCAVIPSGVVHRVVAGAEDLYLLAKFIPALL